MPELTWHVTLNGLSLSVQLERSSESCDGDSSSSLAKVREEVAARYGVVAAPVPERSKEHNDKDRKDKKYKKDKKDRKEKKEKRGNPGNCTGFRKKPPGQN